MNTNAPPESILSLLRKIKALAADPSAPAGERAAAESRLAALLQKHGVDESILTDKKQTEWSVIVKCAGEELMVCQMVMMVMELRSLKLVQRVRTTAKPFPVCLWFRLPCPSLYDVRDAYSHFQPYWEKAKKPRLAEAKKLRAALKALPEDHAVAFCAMLQIFPNLPEDDSDAQPAILTDEDIEAQMRRQRMMKEVKGSPWSRHKIDAPEQLALA